MALSCFASQLFGAEVLRLPESTLHSPQSLHRALESLVQTLVLTPGSILCKSGNALGRCYYVEHGYVEAQGAHVYHEGDLIGTRSLLTPEMAISVDLKAGLQGATLLVLLASDYQSVAMDQFITLGAARGLCIRAGRQASLKRDVGEFRGIRFAAAPRFEAPLLSRLESVDAFVFGPVCPQLRVGLSRVLVIPPVPADEVPFGQSQMHEECLNLNVWTPAIVSANETKHLLPVMVFIHGGAFLTGSGSDSLYNGRLLASQGAVVVTINYRLGALGFLAGIEGVPANLGLLDQLAALTWVQNHIATFGGDPKQVTVFGNSAGAMSIGSLLASPLRGELFHRAILLSGSSHLCLDAEQGRAVAQDFLSHLGGAKTPEALRAVGLADILSATLKTLTGKAAQALQGKTRLDTMPFQPVVDDLVFQGIHPLVHVEHRRTADDVQVFVGCTDQEWTLFQYLDPSWQALPPSSQASKKALTQALTRWAEGDARFVVPANVSERAASTIDFYAQKFERTQDVHERLGSVWLFELPADRLAISLGPERARTFRITASTPRPGRFVDSWSPHTMDLPMLFGTFHSPLGRFLFCEGPSFEIKSAAEQFRAACLGFATNGAVSLTLELQQFGPKRPLNNNKDGLFRLDGERRLWEWASISANAAQSSL